MIHLSQTAIRELKRLEARDTHGSGVVRLAISPGGCAGFVYGLEFRQATKADDQVLKFDSLRVVISAAELARCEGLTVDYAEDLMGGNFRFTNPLARQTCGCGISFNLEAAPVAENPVADCTELQAKV